MFVFGFLTLFHIFSISSAVCPTEYQAFENSCYKVYDTSVTRPEAASACASEDAHLVDIQSSEEQDYIAGLLSASGGGRRGKDVWFGLAARDPGGELLWSDGTVPEFTSWAGGVEEGRNEEVDCVRMNRKKNFQWADRTCEERFKYVCEFEEIPGPNSVYLGCFIDTDDRALPDNTMTDDSMTVGMCLSHCLSAGQRYAGLQYVRQCFCGNNSVDYAKYERVSEEECSSDCGGNAEQICGGSWRLSVYDLIPDLNLQFKLDSSEELPDGEYQITLTVINTDIAVSTICILHFADDRQQELQLSAGVNNRTTTSIVVPSIYITQGCFYISVPMCDGFTVENTEERQLCLPQVTMTPMPTKPPTPTQPSIPTQPTTPTQPTATTQPPTPTQPPMPCSAPIATIVNKATDVYFALAYTESTRFSLQGRVNATCARPVTLRFDWSIRKYPPNAEVLAGNSGTAVSLPKSVNTRNTELIVPKHSLQFGVYRFQFAVVQVDKKIGERTFAQDETWIEIVASELVAVIKGGSARTQGGSAPLLMDASESYDPDDIGDQQDVLQFTWFCQKKREGVEIIIGDDLLLGGNFNASDRCFGESIRLPYTNGYWQQDSILAEGQKYVFTVMVSKAGRRGVFAAQRLTILPGNPPQLDIRCVKNCGQRLVAEKRLVLSVECTAECESVDANSVASISYSWDAVSSNGIVLEDQLNWKQQTTTGRKSSYLVVKSGTFHVGEGIAAMRVTGTKPSSSSGYAEYAITVNAAPHPGTCTVDPWSGYALQTTFIIACVMFVDEDVPLTYTVVSDVNHPAGDKAKSSNHLPSVLYSGVDAISPPLYLPLGAADQDYIVPLFVEVRDLLGAATTVTLNATVLPPQMGDLSDSTEYIEDLTTGADSKLQGFLDTGDYQTATQVIGTVGSVLNAAESTDTSEDDKEREARRKKRSKIRESLVASLADVPVESVVALRQTSATLALVTQDKSEVSQEAQLKASTAFTQMGSFLKAQSSGGDEEQGVIEEAATSIVSGLSNVLNAATVSITFNLVNETQDGAQSGNDSVSQKKRSVSMSTLSTISDLQDAVVANKVPSEAPTVIATDTLAISVNRQERDTLGASAIGTEGISSGAFMLPAMEGMHQFLPDNYTGAVDTQMVELSINPFSWSASGNDLDTSSVVGLQLKTTTQSPIELENLSADVDIFVPTLSDDEETLPSLLINLTLGGFAVVEFNVSDVNITQHVTIQPIDNMGLYLLCCLIHAGENVSSAMSCETNTTLPTGLGSGKDRGLVSEVDLAEAEYTWRLPPDVLAAEDSYQVVVSVYNNTDSVVGAVIPLKTRVLSTDCVFWDEREESWSGRGCKVGALTTTHQTHCQCNHLSYFTSNFLVKPNKVDFFADAKLFLTFVDNPLVVTTVAVILGVYVVAAVWARRKDKHDELKTLVITLSDSDPFAHYRYTVTVFTGMRRASGTTATVTLTLTGENGSSLSHVLQDRQRPVLQRGGVDSFLITTRESLGTLTDVRIWHDNAGTSPGWYLNRIVVHDLETDERSLFLCSKWLAVDMGNGQIDTTCSVATEEELKEFGNLFSDRTTKGLTDGHLWFSVFSRPARSHFTRLQRLSCCLALLMTTMLSSIMFYGVPTDPEDQVLDFGSFRVTVREIIIGIESSIIAFPINLVIVQIFRMAQAPAEIQQQKRKQRKPAVTESAQHLMSPRESSNSWESGDTPGLISEQRRSYPMPAIPNCVEHVDDTTEEGEINDPKFQGTNVESIELQDVAEHVRMTRFPSSLSDICKNSTAGSRNASNQVSPVSTTKGVFTCDSALSYFGGESSTGTSTVSHNPSELSLSNIGQEGDISSSDSSSFEDSHFVFPGDRHLPRIVGDISSSESDDAFAARRGVPHKQVASESSVSSRGDVGARPINTGNIRKPVTHNEILYHKLEEIVIDLENMSPDKFSSEKEYLKAKEEAKALVLTAKSIRTPSLTSSSSNQPSTNVSDNSTFDTTSGGSRRCSGRLPHWFIYVGWFILTMTTLVSAYVIMLYGLKYGKQRSKDWLVSLFISTFQSILITQPLKVLLLAVFVAMILKKWEEDDTYDEVEEVDMETVNADHEYKHMMKKRRESVWYKPPQAYNVCGARLRKLRERKMYALLREICGYVFFVWLVTMLAYSHRDRNSYYLTKHTKDLFFNNKIYRKMTDLRRFFVWADKILLPALYEDGYGSDFQSSLLGGVRMRQVRVQQNSCNIPSLFVNEIDRCNAPYTVEHEDTMSYNSTWTNVSPDSSQSQDPWLYHPDLARRFWGHVTTYEQGGYVANLGSTMETAKEMLRELQESLWLDEQTRALFVEWTVYNANTNLFCVVSFTLEMSGTGGFLKHPYIQSVRLYRYTANFQLFIIALELVFTLYIFYYIYVEVSKYRQERAKYFRCVWNWIEMTSILICVTLVAIYIYRYVVTKRLRLDSSWDEFVSFHLTANVDDAFAYLMAFLVIICTVKFLHLLRLNPRMYLLTTVISQSSLDLIAFTVLITVFLCSYTVLFNLIFGAYLDSYHSYKMAFANLFNLLLGTFNHLELLSVYRFISPVMVMSYMFIATYIIMNLFIAALSLAMNDVRRNPKYSEDGKLGLLLIDKILSLLGFDNRSLQKHLNT